VKNLVRLVINMSEVSKVEREEKKEYNKDVDK
jgi:hypothetical protein